MLGLSLKLTRTQAIYRLRASVIALLFFTTGILLLPLPSTYSTLLYKLSLPHASHRVPSPLEAALFYAEGLICATLLVNIAQAAWSIRAPRKAPPPPPAPSVLRSASQPASPLAKSWRGNGKPSTLSPNTTPQRQRPFSTSHPQTPLSDPHNLAHSYSLSFPSGSPDTSFASTTSSLPATPSPISAYRGRRNTAGRALDTSLLSRMTQDDSDDDA